MQHLFSGTHATENTGTDRPKYTSGDSDFLPPLKLVKNYYTNIDLLILFPPTKYTNSIVQLGKPWQSLENHKPKWNKALLDEIIEIGEKTYRKPTEWFN